jgi:hypothetical protein
VISRRTLIWFALLLVFTAGLQYDKYQTERPCREWKAAHPGVDPKTDVEKEIVLPDGTLEVSFNLCNVQLWSNQPIWVKLCVLGWLVSLIGFIQSLVRDIYRWVVMRRTKAREPGVEGD